MHSSRTIYSHTLRTVCDVFDACDKDGNGRLSFEEFEDAMLRLDLGLGSTEVRAIFDATDKDHDGRLDHNEFARELTFRHSNADTFAAEHLKGAVPGVGLNVKGDIDDP